MPDKMLPASRPEQTREKTLATLVSHGITDSFALVGIRGYYLKTMGDPTKNDRGIYDDAIILITPHAYVTFNANVDPSVLKPGMATLQPGLYRYKVGIHGLSHPVGPRRYEALVQASKVTILRQGATKTETDFFGINIHRGSNTMTSSAGCQTIPPPQWEGFLALVKAELKRSGRRDIPYLLV